MVCLLLPKEQDIFRAAYPHLGSIFAAIRPSQSISLVVFPDNIRYYRNHAKIKEPVLHIVSDALCMERFHHREPGSCYIPEQHPVLDMDGSHPPRLKHPEQLRREEIHLGKKVIRILIVPEVVIIGAVLVMVAERDRGMYQVNAVAFHCPRFLHTVTIHRFVMISPYRSFFSASFHAHLPFQPLCLICRVQTIFLHDPYHLCNHVIMVLPLFQQCFLDLALILHVDDVDHNRFRLQKSVAPVDCLNEIIKLIINSQKNLPVTVPLKVASGS